MEDRMNLKEIKPGTKRYNARQHILKIAQDVFSKYGYKRATLDDIANAIGKGKSSLYYYFESKEDLFHAVVLNEVEMLTQKLDQVINRNTDPIDKLRDYMLTKITTFRRLGDFHKSLESDSAALKYVSELIEHYEQDEIRFIKRILIEGVRKNVFEIYDFKLAATGITMAITGLERPLSSGTYGNINLENSVDIILKIICYGIAKK